MAVTSTRRTTARPVRAPAPRPRPAHTARAAYADARGAALTQTAAAATAGPYRPGSGGALAKFLESDSQVKTVTASVNPALYN